MTEMPWNGVPTSLEIHLTYRCDYRCPNCLSQASQAPSIEEMSILDISRIVQESVNLKWPWKRFTLHGGEPTLHVEFGEICRMLAEYRDRHNPGLDVLLCTNGMSNKAQDGIRIAGAYCFSIGVSQKNPTTRKSDHEYVSVNVAPLDTGEKFSLGCYVSRDCGMAVNGNGYFECSVAAASARVFGWEPISKTLLGVNRGRIDNAYNKHCGYCGFSALNRSRVHQQETSITWKEALDKYNTREPSISCRRVLLSSTLDCLYSVFMPIATVAWNICGWRPTFLLVGTHEEWKDRLEFQLSCRFGANVFWIPKIEGFADSTVAQLARLFGQQLLDDPSAFLMTGDVDMIPLCQSYWSIEFNSNQMMLWYGNAYPFDPPRYPLCNIGATCQTWHEVIGKPTLIQVLQSELGCKADKTTAWNFDELFVGQRIRSWNRFPSGVTIIPRKGSAPLQDRADRVSWPIKTIPTGLIDAHLPRPAYEPQNAVRIENLLRAYYPAMLTWVEEYLQNISRRIA